MMKARRNLTVGLIVVLVVVGMFAVRRRASRRAAGMEGPGYRTATVIRGDVALSVSATGVLEPLTTVDVKANVSGEVMVLAVDVGEVVKKGHAHQVKEGVVGCG